MFLFMMFCAGLVIVFFSIKKYLFGTGAGFVVHSGVILGIGLLMHVATQLVMPTLDAQL